MKKCVILLAIGLCFSVHAFDGIYLGGEIGQVGLTGRMSNGHNSNIGFGVDLGVRTSSLFDLLLQYQHSSHSNNLSVNSITIGPELQLGPHYDFVFTVGGGPGFYFFNDSGVSESKFGLNFSGGADYWLEDKIRLGLVFRFNLPFGPDIGDNYWTAMMRIGYFFEN